MSYLAGHTEDIGKKGEISYNRRKAFFHTVFFVLGISFAFFILGIVFTSLGSFFQNNRLLFTRIAGIIIIILGLFQVGIFDLSFLNREKKFHLNLGKRNVNPLIAFILGFTFSFAWTPCVGPALSSVLILASSANNSFLGNILVLVYAIGFIIPFLLLGLFTTQVLNFLKNHQKFLKYTVKIAGIILIIIGLMTFTGWMNNISGYLNSLDLSGQPNGGGQQDVLDEDLREAEDDTEEEITGDREELQDHSSIQEREQEDTDLLPAIDFTLIDQYGQKHTLSDYRGKVVFLNFWATWCPPCKEEIPDIQALYEEYNQNQEDVVFLGVASPDSKMNPRELTKEEIIAFLQENKITYPVVFDESGETWYEYAVSSLPTTFMIDKEGNINGYAPGMLSKDRMESILEETLNANESS